MFAMHSSYVRFASQTRPSHNVERPLWGNKTSAAYDRLVVDSRRDRCIV